MGIESGRQEIGIVNTTKKEIKPNTESEAYFDVEKFSKDKETEIIERVKVLIDGGSNRGQMVEDLGGSCKEMEERISTINKRLKEEVEYYKNKIIAIKNENKNSGKPEIKCSNSYKEYLDDKYKNSKIEKFENNNCDAKDKQFLGSMGLDIDKIIIQKIDNRFIDIKSEYNPDIDLHQVFNLSLDKKILKNKNQYELSDIIFVSKNTGKCFSVMSILPENVPVIVDTNIKFKAWGGPSIRIPPIGKGLAPINPIERGMWNVYKKIEPLVIFHEVAHTRQSLDFSKINEKVEAERDAWRFGVQGVRKLKEEGIDLLPDVNNTEIMSRLELGLLSYDVNHPENLPRRFSSYMENTELGKSSLMHDLTHILKFVGVVFKIIKKDPSLVTDTLLYKGSK
jgi:hypothetical protein